MKPKNVILTMDSVKLFATQGETILQAALNNRIEINHSCGGNGTCGTCRIFVQKGLDLLEKANEIEAEFAAERGFAENERLACQTLAVSGVGFSLLRD
jgi:2Fe-2S ferredoxin